MAALVQRMLGCWGNLVRQLDLEGPQKGSLGYGGRLLNKADGGLSGSIWGLSLAALVGSGPIGAWKGLCGSIFGYFGELGCLGNLISRLVHWT